MVFAYDVPKAYRVHWLWWQEVFAYDVPKAYRVYGLWWQEVLEYDLPKAYRVYEAMILRGFEAKGVDSWSEPETISRHNHPMEPLFHLSAKKQSPTIFVTGLSELAATRHPVCHNPVSFLWLLGDIFLNYHSKTLPLNELEKKQFCLNMHLWYIINIKKKQFHALQIALSEPGILL